MWGRAPAVKIKGKLMKKAAMILGILGSLLVVGLGMKYHNDYNKNKEAVDSMIQIVASSQTADAALVNAVKATKARFYMIGLGLAALIFSIMINKFGKVSGFVMIVASLVPGLIFPTTFVFSFLLIIAGAMALLSKS